MLDKDIEALRGRIPNILEHERSVKNAVLLPLVESEGEICVLFEKRASHMKQQPGEVCFPGGRIEDHDSGKDVAAVRETCEELGLEAEDIELIAPLDIMVSPFNLIIYPYVGYIKDYRRIKPNPDEVESFFCVPLNYLLQCNPISTKMPIRMDAPQDYPYELIPQGKDYPFRSGTYPIHFFSWNGHVIWGMTARILINFLSLLKKECQ